MPGTGSASNLCVSCTQIKQNTTLKASQSAMLLRNQRAGILVSTHRVVTFTILLGRPPLIVKNSFFQISKLKF